MKGICLSVPKNSEDYSAFLRAIGEVLPAHGYDTLVFLVRYLFPFRSHPGVTKPGALTMAQAKEIAALCRRMKIRLVPKINLMGH
jgi:hypothetical protein